MNAKPDIKSFLNTLARSWWAGALGTALILLMIGWLALEQRKDMPHLKTIPPAAAREIIPLDLIQQLLEIRATASLVGPTNAPPPPGPALPTTKKLSLVYQGFFETGDGRKQAFLKVAGEQISGTNGSPAVLDYVIADFNVTTMTLRNETRTNVLKFNVPVEIEVPLKRP